MTQLYRLDYHAGAAVWPVRNTVGMSYLGRRMDDAVQSAETAARAQRCDVVVTRISEYGSLKSVLCVHADGRRERIK